jgi:hypothetical protein
MWRKLTLMLFLFVLAQTASALPITETLTYEDTKTVSISQMDLNVVQNIDNDEQKNQYNLPRFNQVSPSLFSAEIQISPNYFLVMEFFKSKLVAGLYKNLANPPEIPTWFERLSHKTNSSRLSGWKDGNSLYSSRITYYS